MLGYILLGAVLGLVVFFVSRMLLSKFGQIAYVSLSILAGLAVMLGLVFRTNLSVTASCLVGVLLGIATYIFIKYVV